MYTYVIKQKEGQSIGQNNVPGGGARRKLLVPQKDRSLKRNLCHTLQGHFHYTFTSRKGRPTLW